jgi:glycosyltransferase involved in cell wall biosynthesis
LKHIYFTVTSDIAFDQRMNRICHTLASNGFTVTLVGRHIINTVPLEEKTFAQKLVSCFFNKGFLFYAEYNIRLFILLLFSKADAVCAIDLDTILPCLLVSKMKGIVRIYDAHEYFTELKEIRERPLKRKVWKQIETLAVPKFNYGYTVSQSITDDFNIRFSKQYITIRNLPVLLPIKPKKRNENLLFFGGAVNEARGFEFLIPALKALPYNLLIAGDGNFMPQLKKLIHEHNVIDKVVLKGWVSPSELKQLAQQGTLGISLVERDGLNQFFSLTNKFFDYLHAGLPQVCMNFPEYKNINDQYKVAVLIDDLNADLLAATIKELMENDSLLKELSDNCLKAREELNWQQEQQKLIAFYKQLFV